MTAPYELVSAPFTVYTAPVGEAFPSLDVADPTSGTNWELLGESGHKSITYRGVLAAHENSYATAPFVLPGATAPSKIARNAESLTVSFSIADMTAEVYAKALNGATIADVPPGPGTAGYRTVTLLNESRIDEHALLIRGEVSPYIATGRSQYELPRAVQAASPRPVFIKREPVGLAFRFRVIRDPSSAYGVLKVEDAAAT
jgi:hypothetical protein